MKRWSKTIAGGESSCNDAADQQWLGVATHNAEVAVKLVIYTASGEEKELAAKHHQEQVGNHMRARMKRVAREIVVESSETLKQHAENRWVSGDKQTTGAEHAH